MMLVSELQGPTQESLEVPVQGLGSDSCATYSASSL